MGPERFIHRLKIGVIDEAMRRTADNVLYVDADTFFVRDVSSVASSVTEKQCVMHLHEHQLESLRSFSQGGTVEAMYEFVNGGSVRLADGTTLTLSRTLSSWNAGVIGLHQSHARLLPDVYAVCDQLFENTRNRVSEQYAFSIILQRALTIQSADSTVYHYYDPVKKTIVDEFIEKHLNSSWLDRSLEDRLGLVRDWTQLLPDHIARHPLILEDTALRCLAEKRRIAALAWAFRVIRRRKGVGHVFARRFVAELRRTLQ